MPTTADNKAEKAEVQTLQASFSPRKLAVHCGQKGVTEMTEISKNQKGIEQNDLGLPVDRKQVLTE